MPIDVPAHVQYTDYIENHVQVQAGNNWDFSRTARVTPIALVPDPTPAVPSVEAPEAQFPAQAGVQDGLPDGDAIAVVHFSHEGITIGRAEQKLLLELPKDTELIVVAHGDAAESDADRLSRVRAKAVTSFLRSKGYTVKTVKAVGASRPTAKANATENRIVAVYASERMSSL